MSDVNLVGKVFYRLTLIKKLEGRFWECLCSCGNIKKISISDIKRGYTKSCGCYNKEVRSKTHRTHGLSKTPEYRVWKAIKTRCDNKNNHKYPTYGGRGIKVCKQWLNDFPQFLKDMGLRPNLSFTIERKNVNGDYELSNCKWATSTEQSRNKTDTIYVMTEWGLISLPEAAEKSGINYKTLKTRLVAGWPTEKLFSKINYNTKRPL